MVRFRLGAIAAVLAGLSAFLVAAAVPAFACSIVLPPLVLDVAQTTPGGRVHVSGGPYVEALPAAEQPSTTTTTLPGGGIVVGCPPTRPATSQERSRSYKATAESCWLRFTVTLSTSLSPSHLVQCQG